MKPTLQAGALAVLALGAAAAAVAASDTPPAGAATWTAAPPVAGPYTLDKAHASLVFRINHLGFSNYTARFRRFDAQLQFDPANLIASRVTATVDARSLETDFPDPAKLDFNAMLQNEQWLNTKQYPEMTYRTDTVELVG
jgi:polyisoprenoid-binding protein YceI